MSNLGVNLGTEEIMDRRVLLKNLATLQPGCLGALLNPATDAKIDLDALLNAATDADIEQVWQQLESSPIRFEVSESGALSIAGMSEPTCRGEWLTLRISDSPSAVEIVEMAEQYWVAGFVVAQAYLEAKGDDDGDPNDVKVGVLKGWLNESDENVQYAGNKLRDWLASEDLDEDDYAEAEKMGNTSQSAPARFWRDGILDRRAFGVVIAEGDHPGSTYYAAELRVPLDEANAAANTLGVPIRFEGFNPTSRPDPAPVLNQEKFTEFTKSKYQKPWQHPFYTGRILDETVKRPAEHRWRAVDMNTERGSLCVVRSGKDVAPGVSAGQVVRFIRAPIPGTAVAVFQYAPGVYAFSHSDNSWVGKENAHYCCLIDRRRLRLLEPWDLETTRRACCF